jgi:hypothetical protein
VPQQSDGAGRRLQQVSSTNGVLWSTVVAPLQVVRRDGSKAKEGLRLENQKPKELSGPG